MKANATGTTVVQYEIDSQGSISNAIVLKSAGQSPEHKLLDETARQMILSCKYPAGTVIMPGKATTEYVWRIN